MAEKSFANEEGEGGESSSSSDDDVVGPSLGDGRTAVPDAVAYAHLRAKRAAAAAKSGGGECVCVFCLFVCLSVCFDVCVCVRVIETQRERRGLVHFPFLSFLVVVSRSFDRSRDRWGNDDRKP